MSIRILIADDHAAIRAGLRAMLDGDGIEVVGEAADGAAAVRNARALRPDVVLMDVRMPGQDGIEATRLIAAESIAHVLVLTTFDVDDYVFGAVRAGAAGFLLKSATADTLRDAVRAVARGEGALATEVTRRVLARLASAPEPTPPAGFDELTGREREVLAALGRGLSNAELAAELSISETTAKTHVSRILAKLGAASRMQLAVIAREAGLR
ncbi:response regulator transcription factor [Agromyces archimandritae]|uniref:Response regulator transcription factor n=1 Tax=Agromyces archimandritae TaxID=2781962 RepID=A0A975IML7_9MICO|nr:response regulator transcription factor [Agromyces archimandritae]QTX03638.1 response regulator transcription factor [Agromyces archimandritae]